VLLHGDRLGPPSLGESRLTQLDDNLDERFLLSRRTACGGQRGKRGEQTDPEEKRPLQIVNGTSSALGSWRDPADSDRSPAAEHPDQQHDHENDEQQPEQVVDEQSAAERRDQQDHEDENE
jgi:hypothetical protein